MRCRNWKLRPLTRGRKSSANYCSRHCSGFTLLEVIIALGIVAVGILAVSRAVTGYVETTTTLEQRMVANWVAANRLATLRIQKITPVPGTSKGVEEMAGRAWYLSETITATADPYLYRVDIVVYTDSAETDEVGTLHGYLLNEEALTLSKAIGISRLPVGANSFAQNSFYDPRANEFAPTKAEIASSQAPRDRSKCPWCNDEMFLSRAIKDLPNKLPAVIARSAVTKQSFTPGLSILRLPRFARDDYLLVSNNEA